MRLDMELYSTSWWVNLVFVLATILCIPSTDQQQHYQQKSLNLWELSSNTNNSNCLSYETTSEMVLKAAFTIALHSNGLITDVLLFSPEGLTSCYRRTIAVQLQQWSSSYPFNVAITSCQESRSDDPDLQLQTSHLSQGESSSKVLLVDCCGGNEIPVIIPHYNNSACVLSKWLLLKIVTNETISQFLDRYWEIGGINNGVTFLAGIVEEPKDDAVRIYEVFRTSQTGSGRTICIYKSLAPELEHSSVTDNNTFGNMLYQQQHKLSSWPNNISSPLLSEKGRSNFGGVEFRVAGVLDPNYAYDTSFITLNETYEGNGNRSNDLSVVVGHSSRIQYKFHDGFAVEILKALEVTMNFKTVPKVAHSWGHVLSNDADDAGNNKTTWCGMINLLLNNEADLAISSTADRPFRREVVDFNLATNELRLSAFFRKPNSLSGGNRNAIAQPFSTGFWCILLFWVLVAGLSSLVFSLFMDKAKRVQTKMQLVIEADIDPDCWGIADHFQWVLGALCLQGYYNYPTQTPQRILITVGSLLAVVVYAAYSGNLFSFLSVVIEPIQSLSQLIATKFVFNVVDSPLPLAFLKQSQNDEGRNIYERRQLEPKFQSTSQIVQQMNAGSFVFIVDHMNAYQSMNSEFSVADACQIREIVIPHAIQTQSSMVPKNSTAKRIIDYQILRMLEYGLIKKWRKQYLHSKPTCDLSNRSSNFEGVNIERVYIIWHLLVAGGCLALLLMITEIFWYSYSRFKHSIQQQQCWHMQHKIVLWK